MTVFHDPAFPILAKEILQAGKMQSVVGPPLVGERFSQWTVARRPSFARPTEDRQAQALHTIR